MKEQAQAPRRKRPVLQMAKARLATTEHHTRVPYRTAPVAARRRA